MLGAGETFHPCLARNDGRGEGVATRQGNRSIVALSITGSVDSGTHRAIATRPDVLARLADEALAEHHAGRTEALDPDRF